MSTEALLDEARKLSVDERLRLLEEIWNTISADHPTLTDEQRQELDSRLAEHHADPHAGDSWPDVRAQIQLS
jgi:putative addiction module component (TIGR02574 family)